VSKTTEIVGEGGNREKDTVSQRPRKKKNFRKGRKDGSLYWGKPPFSTEKYSDFEGKKKG